MATVALYRFLDFKWCEKGVPERLGAWHKVLEPKQSVGKYIYNRVAWQYDTTALVE